MSLGRADLIKDLSDSLLESVNRFEDKDDLETILDLALLTFTRYRARVVFGSLSLVADQALYTPPARFIAMIYVMWGRAEQRSRALWDANYPKRIPVVSLIESGGASQLLLDPAPNAADISDLGATFEFRYAGRHVIDDDPTNTTINEADRDLFLMCALAEAMKWLAVRNIGKPITVQKGAQQTRNGTPAALYDQLMKTIERLAV